MRITIAVDNRLSFRSIPPGIVEETPTGQRQRYWHDFFNYAGLHRMVWLYTTPVAHLCDLAVVTGLDGPTGTVDYTIGAAGADGLLVRTVLRDAAGTPIATSNGAPAT